MESWGPAWERDVRLSGWRSGRVRGGRYFFCEHPDEPHREYAGQWRNDKCREWKLTEEAGREEKADLC
eukprot:159416-Hanusia_phi.AAC.3